MQNKKQPMIADIPFPLQDIFRMDWMIDVAGKKMWNKPEMEQIQEFIQWCKISGNVSHLNEEEKKFLEEN